jgi:hypothetical protein
MFYFLCYLYQIWYKTYASFLKWIGMPSLFSCSAII